MPKQHVTLIVPFLNEEKALPIFFERADAELAKIKKKHKDLRFSVLFINDGSTDAGELIVTAARMKSADVQLVNLTRNFGKELALFAGFSYAKSDAVIPMDVDLQDPPEVVDQMIAEWRNGADIVNAKRIKRDEDTYFKRTTATLFYKIFNIFSERPIPENVGDFRLFDRAVVDAIKKVGDHQRFNKEIFAWVGFKDALVEYERPDRSTGSTRYSFWSLWNLALDGIFAGSTLPLRMWSYVGFLVSLFSFLYMVLVVLSTLVLGRDVPGYSSTITLILFFGGLNLLSVGILGEYIGRIFTEVKNRPAFLVRSTHGLDDADG